MASAQLLVVDPLRPNPRHIAKAVDLMKAGEVISYPTDTVYGIGCDLEQRKAIDLIYRIRGLERGHRLSFICPDISTIAQYVHLSDFAHRWVRRLTPGPYTIVLPATRMVPKVLREKRPEVGVRIPDNLICRQLAEQLGRPLISTSATEAGAEDLPIDPEVVRDRMGQHLGVVIDGGLLTNEPSTVLRIDGDEIEVLREGKGPIDQLF